MPKLKLTQKQVHPSLVSRLRMPVDRQRIVSEMHSQVSNVVADTSMRMFAAKLDAIGEALAYIIEKKHTKRKIKIAKSRKPLK